MPVKAAEPAASGGGDWDEPAAVPVVDSSDEAAAEPAPAPAPEPESGTTEFGPGSAPASEDGSAPTGHPIKGNVDSMLFHTQESPAYGRTRAEVWFADEDSARAAGFQSWDANRQD